MNILSFRKACVFVGMLLGSFSAQAKLQCSNDVTAQRGALITFAQQFDVMAVEFGNLGFEAAEAMHASSRELIDRVAGFDAKQAQQFCELLNQHPDLLNIPARLNEVLVLAKQHEVRAASNCLTLPDSAWIVIFNATQALQGYAVAAGGLCGATGCIPLVCIGPCIIAGVAESAAIASQAVLDRADYCETVQAGDDIKQFVTDSNTKLSETEAALEILLPRTDVLLSTRATEVQVQNTMTRADRGFRDIDQKIEELQDVSVSQTVDAQASGETIQVRLIENGLQLDPNFSVVSLILPKSKGGLLEQVREQIAQTIQTYRSLGVDVSAALALFAQGDTAFNANQYKLAYARYRDAYRSLTNPTIKPR